MRVRTAWIVLVALGLGWVVPDLGQGALGVSVAEAKSSTYTRKRVNGRWITGKFTRQSTPARVPETVAERAVAEPPAVPTPQLRRADPLALPPPPLAQTFFAPPAELVALAPDQRLARLRNGLLQFAEQPMERLRLGLEQRARAMADQYR
jgi:hypothetical protein